MHAHAKTASASGISLLELVVAAAVLAALAVIAVPPTIAMLRASREARAVANLKSIAAAEMSLYGSRRRFGVFDELIREKNLPDQFERGAEGGGPPGSGSEAVSDGVYLYSIRFSRDALGITIDADPTPRYAPSHRRFRLRLGRSVSGAAGGEAVMYVAPPSARSPPADAYVVMNGGQ
jgi:type II secretory pathway pseudopilin PulG